MTHFIYRSDDKESILYAASTWATIVDISSKGGKDKPAIYVDISGSMGSMMDNDMSFYAPVDRMQVATAILHTVAKILKKRNPLYDLSEVPVFCWDGRSVYPGAVETGSKLIAPVTLRDSNGAGYLADGKSYTNVVELTLEQFHDPQFVGKIELQAIGGTNHDIWFNHSIQEGFMPLVITDDYYKAYPPFKRNYQNYKWCDGDNILVLESPNVESRMLKNDAEVKS